MTAPTVHGEASPGFEACGEAFAANSEEHGEVGAAFCLHVAGRKVVDVWGGVADPSTEQPWDPRHAPARTVVDEGGRLP